MDENKAKSLLQSLDTAESLGKVDLTGEKVASLQQSEKLASLYGYKSIPLENLPSKGLFYPDNTEIAISAATVSEVRHFSTIDENDPLGTDDKINLVIDKCVRIKFGDSYVSPKELQEADRFYILFCIREYTFINGDNKINIPVKFPSGITEKIELHSSIFSFYELDEKLMKFYDSVAKCFIIETKKAGEISLRPPTIGAVSRIKKWVLEKRDKKQTVDETFIKVVPFIINDWKVLSNDILDRMQEQSLMWDMYSVSAYINWTEKIKIGTKPSIIAKTTAGEETEVDIYFPFGIKSLFVITEED